MSKLTALVHGLDLRKPGAVEALLAFHREQFGDIRMGPEDDPATPPADPAAPPAGPPAADPADKGFPEGTPWQDMTPGQQVNYWKFQSRKHEGAYKALGNVDQLKADAAEYQKHKEATASDTDKAVAKARQEAEAAAIERLSGTLVQQEFRIAAAGQVPADVLTQYLEDVDLKRFIGSDGKPDADRIKTSVARLVPKGSTRDGQWPGGSFAGGNNGGPAPSGKDAGLAEAERRFGKK